ncbi:MAG: efflux RND transporter periplasmic adaptor subunit [Candidatus Latescibacterota bacterium]|nr:MAG: efflux RND transporter periplasmic adaptor subunit [Candidatus Latescibacterota bacterium]
MQSRKGSGRTRRRARATDAIALVLISALIASCGRGTEPDEGAGADSTAHDASASADTLDEKRQKSDTSRDTAVPVEIAVLVRGPIESVIRASANLEAELSVSVLAEASRRVTELLVEEGDRVRKGQVLLRLQSEEQRSTLARVKTLLAKAEREHERQKRLHERDLTTDQALNDATDELERQRLAQTDAERELSYTEVAAPLSGTVTARHVNLGDHVQLQQPLFDIIDFESLVARIFVPEKNLKQLQKGQRARISATAIRDEPYVGEVQRIAPVVDPRSGTVKVTVAVGGQEGLRPGLYVDVELVTAVNEQALLVPKRALVYDNDQIFVYRLQPDRTVARLRLLPRLSDRDHVEPVGGFAEGDSIVIAGQAGLKHGARVKLPGEEEESAAEEQVSASGSDGSR